MEDTISRAFAYMLIGFGFFILAPLILMLGSDITSRSYISTVLNEFTENARSEGVIRKTDYNRLVSRLGASGQTYIIKLEHKSRTAVPNEAGDGYEASFRSYNLNDLFAVWDGYGEDGEPDTGDEEESADYILKSGDYISVSIVSQSSTMGSRLLGILSGQPQGVPISAYSGGMVGG